MRCKILRVLFRYESGPSLTLHDEHGSFVAADATAKMEDRLLTPAGSYTDDPFQRAENSCLP